MNEPWAREVRFIRNEHGHMETWKRYLGLSGDRSYRCHKCLERRSFYEISNSWWFCGPGVGSSNRRVCDNCMDAMMKRTHETAAKIVCGRH